MKNNKDYIQDIAEIRSMMERSSKFLSLSGWAGIMAGVYALAGAYIAYRVFGFQPDAVMYSPSEETLFQVIILALLVFLLAIGTAVFFSYKSARKKAEKLWNPTSRRLLLNMAVPIIAGGLLILILISQDLIGLVAPFALLFYGFSMFNAGKYTYQEVKIVGLVEIALGLIGSYFVEYGLLFWAIGFGAVHIVYGVYMHYKYER